MEKEVEIGPTLSPEERKQVVQLVEKYKDILAWELSDVTPTHLYQYPIERLSDLPIAYPPYRATPRERQIIEDEVQKLLKAGFIKPANSAYAAPCLVVPKREGGARLVIDYRGLNS